MNSERVAAFKVGDKVWPVGLTRPVMVVQTVSLLVGRYDRVARYAVRWVADGQVMQAILPEPALVKVA